MNRVLILLSFTVLAALCAPAAHAACGGGGYAPATSQTSTSGSTQSATPTTYHATVSTANFDASYFHKISGKLRLNYEQSTKIIAALNDIRKELDEGKKIEPRVEFEKRLATILDAQQFKDYQTYKS
jgi:hypothetical protein